MRALLAALAAAALLPLTPSPGPASGGCAATPAATDFDGDGTADIAVGDPFADATGRPGAGAVQVTRGTSGTGPPPVVVRAPEPAAGEAFGWAVALGRLDADRCADLVVGAPYADVAGQADAGAVYLVYGGTGRTERLAAPRPQRDAHFGWSVAYTPEGGGVVAAGAPHEDDGGARDAGAAYVLRAGSPGSPARIAQDGEGVPGNSEPGDLFGWALALDRLSGAAGEVDLAVGVPYENTDGAGRQDDDGGGDGDAPDTGDVTVVRDVLGAAPFDGERWELDDVAGIPPRAGDRFGYAVAGAGGRLAIGAPLVDSGEVADAGLVHVLTSAGGRELARGTTFAQGSGSVEGVPAAGEAFGFSVALGAGDTPGDVRLAVGVPFDGPDRRGAVHLVPLGDPAGDRLPAPPEPRADDHFGWSVAFTGNRLAVGAPDAGNGGTVSVLGRNEGAFTLVTPAPDRGPDTPVDFGAALAG